LAVKCDAADNDPAVALGGVGFLQLQHPGAVWAE
jgi:hypothetical protein